MQCGELTEGGGAEGEVGGGALTSLQLLLRLLPHVVVQGLNMFTLLFPSLCFHFDYKQCTFSKHCSIGVSKALLALLSNKINQLPFSCSVHSFKESSLEVCFVYSIVFCWFTLLQVKELHITICIF